MRLLPRLLPAVLFGAVLYGQTGTATVQGTIKDGAAPTDFDARNRFRNHRRHPDVPKHRLRWNWIVDLPFGRNHAGILSLQNSSNSARRLQLTLRLAW